MDGKQKEREYIISLYKKNKSTYEISEILGISQTKASFWIRRWKKTGSLNNLPKSGRPTPLNNNFLGSLKQQLAKKLDRKAGLNSKEVLDLLNKKTNKEYSLRQVQRILHKIGFSLITPRPQHINKDPEAANIFAQEFKKNSKKNIWVIQ